jgi:acyl-coenzyme A synthetase/AMP-(fatty) acid ligase
MEGAHFTEDQWRQLQEMIRKAVGPYAVPKEWIPIAAFAETATGKIDRKRIVTPYLQGTA